MADIKAPFGSSYRNMQAEVKEVFDNYETLFPALKGKQLELAGFFWFQGYNDKFGDSEHPGPQRYLALDFTSLAAFPTISLAFAATKDLSFGVGFVWGGLLDPCVAIRREGILINGCCSGVHCTAVAECTLSAELNIVYCIITQAAAVIGSPLCMHKTGSSDVFRLYSLQLTARFLDIECALVVQGEGDYRDQGDGQNHG